MDLHGTLMVDQHVRLVDQVMCYQDVVSVMKAIIEALLAFMEYVNVSMTIEL